MRFKLTTDNLSTDDLSTDLAADLFASNVSDDVVDSSSDAGDKEVYSSNDSEVSPFISLSKDTSLTPPSEPMEDMLKAFQAPWVTGKGEAGNFVELSTRGGIMEYDPISKQRKLVFYAL